MTPQVADSAGPYLSLYRYFVVGGQRFVQVGLFFFVSVGVVAVARIQHWQCGIIYRYGVP